MGDLSDPLTVFYSDDQSHPDTTSETSLISFTTLKTRLELHIDVNTLTQDTVIRGKEEVDGTNARIFFNKTYSTTNGNSDFDDDTRSIIIIVDGTDRDIDITFQSLITEGTVRAIPIRVVETSR